VTTLDEVRAALALSTFDGPGAQRRMAPQPRAPYRPLGRTGAPRQASVLVLLYPGPDGLAFPLVQRAQHPLDVHSGQISLPGGSREAGETPLETALREACEEVGVCGAVTVLGALTPLYIPPSDFEVQPFVGWLPAHPVWHPDPAEVVEVVECALDWLLDDARKVEEDWTVGGLPLHVPWYGVEGRRVWGATAIILGELESRLRALHGEAPA